MSDYASYRVPSPSTDANLTDADRQKMHDDARKPGRVISDANGTRIEEKVVTGRTATPKPGQIIKRNGQDMLVLEDGDVMPVEAAKNAGLYPTAPDIAPQDKSEQPQQDQPQTQQPDEGWSDETVDNVMKTVGGRLAPSTMEAVVAFGVHGTEELPLYRAQALASSLGLEPHEVQAAYREAYAAAVDKANEIVSKAGVEPDDLYDWLESTDKGRLVDCRDAFARGQVRPLQQAARDYVAKYRAGVDSVTAERMLDPENTVHGGRIYRAPNGTLMVQIDGAEGPMTLAQAIAGGHVRVSRGE